MDIHRWCTGVEDLLPAVLWLFPPLLIFQLSDSILFFKCIRKFLLTYLVEWQSLTFNASSKELLLLSTSSSYFTILINSHKKNLDKLPSWINIFILHILKLALSAVKEIVGVLNLKQTKSKECFLMKIWTSGYVTIITYIWPLVKNIISEVIAFPPPTPTRNTIKWKALGFFFPFSIFPFFFQVSNTQFKWYL